MKFLSDGLGVPRIRAELRVGDCSQCGVEHRAIALRQPAEKNDLDYYLDPLTPPFVRSRLSLAQMSNDGHGAMQALPLVFNVAR